MDFLEFKSEEDVNEWIGNNYASWINDLQSHAEIEETYQNLLYDYGGNAGFSMHRMLRLAKGEAIESFFDYGSEYDEDIRRIIKLRDSFSGKLISDGIIAYRYTRLRDFRKMLKEKGQNGLLTEYGFMSTTLLPDNKSLKKLIKQYNYNLIMKIYIPKGIEGVPIKFSNLQTSLSENEVILTSGQKMKLKKVGFDFKRMKFSAEVEIVKAN